MKLSRCIAFRQSKDFPELYMPCTNLAVKGHRRHGQRGEWSNFCEEHERARTELLLGILSDAQEKKKERSHVE